MLLFQFGYLGSLSVVTERFLLLLPRYFSLLNKLIVEPAALVKLVVKKSSLFLGGIYSIFKRFNHYFRYIFKCCSCQAPDLLRGKYPPRRAWGY